MRYKVSKFLLMILCLFIGLEAFLGSMSMFVDPSGKLLQMDQMLPYFQVLPLSKYLFQNYLFSGIALLIVNGITNLMTFCLLIKDSLLGIKLGMVFGITLMLWICIQFVIFPFNFLSTSFFILGFIQFILGYTTYVFYQQNHFQFNESNYPNIQKNSKLLVVYFSRLGYTKKIAYQKANEIGASLLEIKAIEKTKDTAGFWWCGRYGMHHWPMPIEKIEDDLTKYDKIILVSPIWVFTLSAPMKEFCKLYKNQIHHVEYVLTHHMKADFKNVADEMDQILELQRESLTSICVRLGKIKSIHVLK